MGQLDLKGTGCVGTASHTLNFTQSSSRSRRRNTSINMKSLIVLAVCIVYVNAQASKKCYSTVFEITCTINIKKKNNFNSESIAEDGSTECKFPWKPNVRVIK